MNDGKPKKVLWTGGFDSTYRVCYLLLVEGTDVQPIYMIDPERSSTMLELETMARMREKITVTARSKARLYPLKIYYRMDYPIPPHVQEKFDMIKAKTHVGRQYLWLATIAEAEGWEGVELCMERYPNGPSGLQKIVFEDPPSPRLRQSNEAALFKYWTFPVLHLTKIEMRQDAMKHGFDDILMMRWFCHHPFGNRACGTCRPCQIALRDGVADNIKFVPRGFRWLPRVCRLFGRALRTRTP